MNSPRQRATAEFILDHLVWFMLAVVLIAFSIFVPNFFQIGIFANIVEASTFVGVMAIGLAIVIIAGHMDLSVESVAALSAMVVYPFMAPPWARRRRTGRGTSSSRRDIPRASSGFP